MSPPRPPALVLLLLGLAAAAQRESAPCMPGPGPLALLVGADVAMTLLVAGGAYCLARRGRPEVIAKARPPEMDLTYQELQGTRTDIYSSLRA